MSPFHVNAVIDTPNISIAAFFVSLSFRRYSLCNIFTDFGFIFEIVPTGHLPNCKSQAQSEAVSHFCPVQCGSHDQVSPA